MIVGGGYPHSSQTLAITGAYDSSDLIFHTHSKLTASAYLEAWRTQWGASQLEERWCCSGCYNCAPQWPACWTGRAGPVWRRCSWLGRSCRRCPRLKSSWWFLGGVNASWQPSHGSQWGNVWKWRMIRWTREPRARGRGGHESALIQVKGLFRSTLKAA